MTDPPASAAAPDIQAERARFASETGRTAEEWLALWRAGEIDRIAPGMSDRYDVALRLEEAGWLP